jgi:hypothetical protein
MKTDDLQTNGERHCADPQEGRSGWRPIDSAPRDGTRVMMWGAGWDAPQTHTWWNEANAEIELRHWHDPPTHWMPLPPPPTGGR